MSTYLPGLSLKTICEYICIISGSQLTQGRAQNQPVSKSQKKIHIVPHPWLVSGLLSSYIYGTYCNVYTVQCNVSTDSSLFV